MFISQSRVLGRLWEHSWNIHDIFYAQMRFSIRQATNNKSHFKGAIHPKMKTNSLSAYRRVNTSAPVSEFQSSEIQNNWGIFIHVRSVKNEYWEFSMSSFQCEVTWS